MSPPGAPATAHAAEASSPWRADRSTPCAAAAAERARATQIAPRRLGSGVVPARERDGFQRFGARARARAPLRALRVMLRSTSRGILRSSQSTSLSRSCSHLVSVFCTMRSGWAVNSGGHLWRSVSGGQVALWQWQLTPRLGRNCLNLGRPPKSCVGSTGFHIATGTRWRRDKTYVQQKRDGLLCRTPTAAHLWRSFPIAVHRCPLADVKILSETMYA